MASLIIPLIKSEVLVITKLSSPISLIRSTSSILEKKVQQLDCFHISNSIDASSSHGFSICLSNDTDIIHPYITGRK